MKKTFIINVIAQNDTIAQEQEPAVQTYTVRHHANGQLTPAEVLSWLPASATPAQQDSAVRANIKIPEVDWSQRPNPLCTPQTKADESFLNVNRPLYYSKSLVQPDSIYRPEYASYGEGVAGDPVPYTIADDNLITGVLLICFVFGMLAIAKSGSVLVKQFKNLFRAQSHRDDTLSETSGELRFQLFLVLQTCLLFSIILFFYVQSRQGDVFAYEYYKVLGIFTGAFAGYFAIKSLLQACVQWVFFDKRQIEQFAKFNLFTMSLEGLVIFPAVLLLSYFDLSVNSVAIYALVCVILIKILSFYKSYLIFFSLEHGYLQNILYFCALEMMPLGSFGGILVMIIDYLKVNL
ncbi:MAG: DUF4271 domain-containing protein [Prevotella sp.]|jgi:hypothetical protein